MKIDTLKATMSLRAKLKRLVLLVDKIYRTTNINKESLMKYLADNDFDVSGRTMERDIQELRDEFNIQIAYNPTTRGYRVEDNDGGRFEKLLRLLVDSAQNSFLIEQFQASREALDAISFESSKALKGYHFFTPLLDAILSRRMVSFTYINFRDDRPRNFLIKPLHLKEYLNRWYLIGLANRRGKEALLTFGLDRMEDLNIIDGHFTIGEQDAAALYSNLIGLSGSGAPQEKVILHVSAFQGKYIKAFPLHSSQIVLADDPEKGVTILLDVIVNAELKRVILSYGADITVQKPPGLRKEVMNELKNAFANY